MSTGEHDLETPTSTEAVTEGAEGEATPKRFDLVVHIDDVGPCKKDLKVEIARTEVEHQFEESLGKMQKDMLVPGFRPGCEGSHGVMRPSDLGWASLYVAVCWKGVRSSIVPPGLCRGNERPVRRRFRVKSPFPTPSKRTPAEA